MLPTVLDSSDSLTLSFQSWEDPGFLGYPGILPSYPSQTQSPILSGGSLGHPGILPWCPLRHRPPPCPEDPLDIPGSSLGVPTDIGPHDVLKIPGTSRDPPFMSPETETPCCPEDPQGTSGSSFHVCFTHRLPNCPEDPRPANLVQNFETRLGKHCIVHQLGGFGPNEITFFSVYWFTGNDPANEETPTST